MYMYACVCVCVCVCSLSFFKSMCNIYIYNMYNIYIHTYISLRGCGSCALT
jgi:hypothetical protein